MGKYASCLSMVDVCKMELEELEGICARYHVLDEDKEALLITEKTGGTLSVEDFYKYIQYHQEEEQKYPFDVGGDGDAE